MSASCSEIKERWAPSSNKTLATALVLLDLTSVTAVFNKQTESLRLNSTDNCGLEVNAVVTGVGGLEARVVPTGGVVVVCWASATLVLVVY